VRFNRQQCFVQHFYQLFVYTGKIKQLKVIKAVNMLAKIVYNCLEEVKCSGMLNTN